MVFEEWEQNRLVKSCTLEPGGLFTTKDFEEGVQTLDTAITDMSVCSVNFWLSKFVQEVSNSSGERYPSRSLYSIICGLKRHLSDVNVSAALKPLAGCVLVYRYTKERNVNELRHNSMYGYENDRNSPVYRYTRTAPFWPMMSDRK